MGMIKYHELKPGLSVQITDEDGKSLVGGVRIQGTKVVFLSTDWEKTLVQEFDSEEEAKDAYDDFFYTLNKKGLTRSQQVYYEYYNQYLHSTGRYPTYQEASDSLGKGTTTIHAGIQKIKDKGYLLELVD